MRDFDNFWKWRLRNESRNEHILDDNHLRETASKDYYKLPGILRRWKAYRKSKNSEPYVTLQDSLRNISKAYDRIRSYSLLEFDRTPHDTLELIWNELGRVKEYGGNINSYGRYYVISVCKPLMLLWGQTLAFDSRVRAHIPRLRNVRGLRDRRWSFTAWKQAMESFQETLNQEPEVVDSFKEVSLQKYGTDSIVPYGRFFDIYYF